MAEHLPPGAGLGGAGALSAAHVGGQRGLRVLSARSPAFRLRPGRRSLPPQGLPPPNPVALHFPADPGHLTCSPHSALQPSPGHRATDRASTPLPRGLAPSWHRPSLSLAGLVPNVWLTPLSCRQGQLPASPVSQLRPRQDPLLYLTLREENTYSPACHLVPLNMEDS